MHYKIAWAIALILILLPQAVGFAAPPKVVKSMPANGDTAVDPKLKEIRITFDQPMGPDMSVVGGGESFPELQGQPRWTSPRTIVIRVRLQPNHDYWLSVNSDRFRNFKNRAGEAAEPYPIQFRTAASKGTSRDTSGDAVPAGGMPSLTPDDNRRAIDLLWSAIRDHYSYRDRLKIDWDALLQSQEATLLSSKTPKEFAGVAGKALARAEDKHIWFQIGNEVVPSYVRPSVPNANYSLLPKLVPRPKKHARAVVSGRWDDGIGYLAIASWDRKRLEGGKSIFDALADVRDTRALIIDVRANGGGDELLAREFAGCFVEKRCLYATHVYRDPNSATGFAPQRERWIEPNANHPPFEGRVAVLSGPAVMSSCESFLLMMKCAPDTVIVGATSQGSSGNPKPHDLRNGVTVLLPSWKDRTPNGEELEGVGVRPDIAVQASPDDFRLADPVLAEALAHLRNASK